MSKDGGWEDWLEEEGLVWTMRDGRKKTPDGVESPGGKRKINKEEDRKDSGWSACVESMWGPSLLKRHHYRFLLHVGGLDEQELHRRGGRRIV